MLSALEPSLFLIKTCGKTCASFAASKKHVPKLAHTAQVGTVPSKCNKPRTIESPSIKDNNNNKIYPPRKVIVYLFISDKSTPTRLT